MIGKTQYQEKEVSRLIDALKRIGEGEGIKNFVVRGTVDGFHIEFSLDAKIYRLKTALGKTRYFPRLSGVQAWMKKMKISIFMVCL